MRTALWTQCRSLQPRQRFCPMSSSWPAAWPLSWACGCWGRARPGQPRHHPPHHLHHRPHYRFWWREVCQPQSRMESAGTPKRNTPQRTLHCYSISLNGRSLDGCLDLSQILPRQFLDSSSTAPRRFLDSSSTVPRQFLDDPLMPRPCPVSSTGNR